MLDTDIEIYPTLPDRLSETKRHCNCPNHDVPMVQLLNDDGTKGRVMAFRGVVCHAPPPPKGCVLPYIALGYIGVSIPKQFGFAPQIHFVPNGKVVPLN